MTLTPDIVEVIVALLVSFLPIILTQSTCGPKVSARLLMDIPCDMSKTNFCELSGTIYPWSAVRRYIYENQGLLRRMYGDQKHYSIVTNEIQEVKEKYDNIFVYDKETKLYDDNQINHQSPYTIKYQPQFRPRALFMDESIEDESVTQSSSTSSGELPNENSNVNNQVTNNYNVSDNKGFPLKENQNNTNQESTTTHPESPISSSTTINDQNPSSNSDSGATIKPEDETTESSSDQNEITNTDKLYMNGQQQESQSSSSTTHSLVSSTPPPSTSSIEIHTLADNNNDNNNIGEINNQLTQPIPPSQPPETEKTPKGKGVNACPVKEEVIAPYWANNTRGEILALLNVYPFEQYVHWEKCVQENNQMFCRDGCRCEQQYRLHRLLAFDPKNECRGIFADWFRFPSCCVCICYDLPETNIFYRSNKRKSRL